MPRWSYELYKYQIYLYNTWFNGCNYNLKRELGFTLRLSPDDKRENERQTEQHAKRHDIPHWKSSQNSQHAEGKNQHTWKRHGHLMYI